MEIKDLVIQKPRFNALCKKLKDWDEKNGESIQLKGLVGSAAATFLAPIKNALSNVFLCVLNDEEDAGYFYHDLCQVGGENDVYFFPSAYKRSIKYGQIDSANEILRTEVIGEVGRREKSAAKTSGMIIVTYPEALAEKVIQQTELQGQIINVKQGEQVGSKDIVDLLLLYGFQRVDYVYEPGQFALRGSLIDVFSYSSEYPFRIDFFGNEIDTLRTFEVDTQLSRETVNEITIIPNLSKQELHGVSLVEFVPASSIVICPDPDWVVEKVQNICGEKLSENLILSEEGDLDALKKLVNADDFASHFKALNQIVTCNTASHNTLKSQVLEFHTSLQPSWHKNFDLISEDLKRYMANGYKIHILSDSPKQIERIEAIFADRGDSDIHLDHVLKPIHEGFADDDTKNCYFTDHQIFDRYHKYNLKSDRARSGKIALSLKELQEFNVGDYIVHVDHGVGKFGGLVRIPVVGTNKTQEMVKVIYQNDDLIFVSIHSLDKLSKYRGKDATPPTLSKLGSGAWERMRERTKEKMKDMARELILLYAKRKDEKGYAFSPDTNMQQELEASFIYEDTPDQLKATMDVKRDMESEKPMDRLICGDVGFGKTEVAIRAALKACADCKQVAVLVPTTVLAFQHYKTFSERLKEFPVRVDYLTRARSVKATKAILKDLEIGNINIIIGTHKLIGKAIKFNDLGLLIIDEEQKFGVKVKEALKQLRTNVDTLTMTATPIPRTLQFSLMGARDLSIIATPPGNRYPIQTELHRDEDNIIREAINFELSRNGQVFFINNRISQLPDIVARIKRLVPDARVASGHGQMEPEILERMVMDFANHEFDVFVCTTIIEAGLDIPNANTMIINHAENYGLSELHQLRGRVGRTNKKAFCYLLSPALSTLTQDARRRLQAIENFAGLGSGIHLAMQDLDIRGAGNLLGGEQSGFIADLGYEAYQKILREAVNELKTQEFSGLYGDADEADWSDETEQFTEMVQQTYKERQAKEKSEKEIMDQQKKDARAVAKAGSKEGNHSQAMGQLFVQECNLESDLELLFPETYIPDSSERITLYQELDNITKPADLDAYCARLVDRFGKIPPEGEELIRVVALRQMGRQLGFERIVIKQNQMLAYFTNNEHYFQTETFGRILNYVAKNFKLCTVRDVKGKRSIVVKPVKSIQRANEIFTQMLN